MYYNALGDLQLVSINTRWVCTSARHLIISPITLKPAATSQEKQFRCTAFSSMSCTLPQPVLYALGLVDALIVLNPHSWLLLFHVVCALEEQSSPRSLCTGHEWRADGVHYVEGFDSNTHTYFFGWVPRCGQFLYPGNGRPIKSQ